MTKSLREQAAPVPPGDEAGVEEIRAACWFVPVDWPFDLERHGMGCKEGPLSDCFYYAKGSVTGGGPNG